MTLTFLRRVSDWHWCRRPAWPAARPLPLRTDSAVRLPLRRQILLPLLAIVALCVVGVSGAHVWLTTRLLQNAVNEQMRSVAETLNESTFPLETNVLRQVRGLSGAELVLIDPASGIALAASDDAFGEAVGDSLASAPAQLPGQVTLQKTVVIAGEPYFTAATKLDRRAMGGSEQLLKLYYPERTFREARWQAIYPSLLVGGVALVLAVALASVVAARVTQPVQLLKRQTQQIAAGDFTPVEPPARDDELRDLALAVNRMATMLSNSADELRQHERSRTLHQIGAGIAHQLRNAATGCRMALDLFRRQQSQWKQDENLTVAARQLELMESYLQRFLVLGRTAEHAKTAVALADIVGSAVELVRPLASHLHIAIDYVPSTTYAAVTADRTSLEQALVNLLTNAIEACATPDSTAGVRIRVGESNSQLTIEVADSGPGFSDKIRNRLGEPFVTSKPEGTGLGLVVAKEIIAQHEGELTWQREAGWTKFIVSLPSA